MEKEKNMDVIQRYSRAQAIKEGLLIDVSAEAKDAGFRFPMAVTSAVWKRCIAVPEDYEGEQDASARLWAVLNMLHYTIMLVGDRNPTYFRAVIQTTPDSYEEIRLKAHCNPGDDYQPVLTIMMPDED